MVQINTANPDNLANWINAIVRAQTEGIRVLGFTGHRNLYTYRVSSSQPGASYYVMLDARTEPHEVYCTCMAGQHHRICKHAAIALNHHTKGSIGPALMRWISESAEQMEVSAA
jgi:hypothetical protein